MAYLRSNTYTVLAILIGFIVVVGTYRLTLEQKASTGITSATDIALSRVTDRHLYGSNQAPTTVVEFSDVECPFCARLHSTLKNLVDESKGEVNWEYRHLPLPSHRNAELGAVATECVSSLTDNDTFWGYLGVLLEKQGAHNKEFYINTASEFGIGTEAFTSCLEDERMLGLVRSDLDAARAFGGRGTPYSIIVFPDGTTKPVSGALPPEYWQSLIYGE